MKNKNSKKCYLENAAIITVVLGSILLLVLLNVGKNLDSTYRNIILQGKKARR